MYTDNAPTARRQAMLHINVLGTPKIYLDDFPTLRFRTRKAQALLIYLAVTEQGWTRDALATLFWPETSDTRARKNLRDILPSLRRQIGEHLLLDSDIIALDPSSPYQCDVTQFSTVLERQLQDIAIKPLADIVALYRGEFLIGFNTARISADFDLWALRERERLQQLALMGFTTLCRRQQEVGESESALATNRQLLKLAPWDEAAHRQQMLLLVQSGQQTAALAHFQICSQILADELDVEPDVETVQLYEQIKQGQYLVEQIGAIEEESADQATKPNAVPHNLPRQLTCLIGRENDIAAIERLLNVENTALLTLVGQGGVGKTRLALAVAHKLQQQASEQFPDGIWFVPLAGIPAGTNATEQIAGAIAQAIDLSLTGGDPLAEQLLRALNEQQLLLILDNFEHLVTEQTFLFELIQTAQQVQVLVTSREQLHLHAEFLYPVAGLPVPANVDFAVTQEDPPPFELNGDQQSFTQTPDGLARYSSVQLFVARVQQHLPEFQLTVRNQSTLGHICQLLGGIPLGIELTAQLYVEQGASILGQLIAELERLDPLELPAQSDPKGLDHLQTVAIDLPTRQRSIRAVFEHSWQLLTAVEQRLLCHCAIFRGGFTRAAILTIGNGDRATLLALVMKSLVRRDSHDRYDLHELVRQYVIDQFQRESTAVHAAAQKHATYFIDLLAGQEEKLYRHFTFHQTIQTEIYNIRAAWAWCLGQSAIAELERSVVCIFIYLNFAGQMQERLALATEAISRLRLLPKNEHNCCTLDRLLAHLLINAGSVGMGIGRNEEGEQWLQEAEQIGETLADPGVLSRVYTTRLSKSMARLEYATMEDRANKALHWAQKANLPYLQIGIHEALGMGLAYQGKLQASLQAATALQQLIQSHHYRCVEAASFFLRSKLYEFQQDWEAALLTAQQGRALCQDHGHLIGINNVEGNMIWANLALGGFDQARQLAIGFGQRARKTGMQVERLYSLYTLGIAEIGLGNGQVGERYLAEALTLAVTLNDAVRQVLIHHQLGKQRIRLDTYDQALTHYQDALQCAISITGLPELQALAQADWR